MSFNANSYRRNKWRREALGYLAKARDIKARSERGESYSWESLQSAVKLARITWRLYRSQVVICDIEKERVNL